MSVLLTVGPKYTGRVACCPTISHGNYADGTDGRTPDRYITLPIDAASVLIHIDLLL